MTLLEWIKEILLQNTCKIDYTKKTQKYIEFTGRKFFKYAEKVSRLNLSRWEENALICARACLYCQTRPQTELSEFEKNACSCFQRQLGLVRHAVILLFLIKKIVGSRAAAASLHFALRPRNSFNVRYVFVWPLLRRRAPQQQGRRRNVLIHCHAGGAQNEETVKQWRTRSGWATN